MMHRLLAALLAVVIPAAAAIAQNVNVDFNRSTGPGAGAPASSYGGVARQAGHWNAVTPSTTLTTTALQTTLGTPGPVLQHRASFGARSAAYGSGDFSNLMADYAYGYTQNGVVEMTFTGLEPGFYVVVVYAGLPQSDAFYEQNGQPVPHTCFLGAYINGSILAGLAQTSGWVSGDVLMEGVNYAEFGVTVPQGGSLRIVATADLTNLGAKIAVNGVQLVKWPSNIVHVKPGGAGLGRSWDDATGDLQAAIERAGRSQGAAPEVWVSEGTYKPALNDRTKSFVLRPGVTVRGGFAGNETSVDARDGTRQTVLSGNIGNIFSSADNSYTVVRFNGSGLATLESLTIRDGRANGPAADNHHRAGGLYANCHSIRVQNCVFENNFGVFGGAAYIFERAGSALRPEFDRSTFRNNATAGNGGAVRFEAADDSGSGFFVGPVFRWCMFQGNTADGDGGAVYALGHDIGAWGCLFNGNRARDGGAVYHAQGRMFWPTSCTFTNNEAVQLTGGVVALANRVWTNGCIFWGNTSAGANSTVYRQLRVGSATSVDADYTCIQGIASVYRGINLTNANPRFISLAGEDGIPGTEDDNPRLSDDSPLIDAAYSSLDTDLDGLSRSVDNLSVTNTGPMADGAPGFTDMGCFENQSTGAPPPCAADWNGDGLVNSSDISAFITAWLGSLQQGTLVADFNGDGVVNSSDISAFITAWLAAVSGGGC